MSSMTTAVKEFDELLERITALFKRFDRTIEPPKSITEVYVVLPTYSQLSAAAKNHPDDEELRKIIIGAIRILKTSIREIIEFQPGIVNDESNGDL
jgi:hypothetical protein